MHPAWMAYGLLRATAVFEEWSLLDEAPLREVVIVRAHYAGGPDTRALLPAVVTPRVALRAFDASTGAPLRHRCGEAGCEVVLPASGPRRVIARFERVVEAPRGFSLRWPSRGARGSRRVVALPRAWAARPDSGWLCPGLDVDELVCVDRGDGAPLALRVPARRSTRPQWLAAGVGALAAGYASGRLGRDAIEARLAALAGVAVATACALTVVGGRLLPWALALAVLAPPGALLGALATRTRAARIVGSIALAALPLAVVAGASSTVALVAAALVGAAVVALVSTPAISR